MNNGQGMHINWTSQQRAETGPDLNKGREAWQRKQKWGRNKSWWLERNHMNINSSPDNEKSKACDQTKGKDNEKPLLKASSIFCLCGELVIHKGSSSFPPLAGYTCTEPEYKSWQWETSLRMEGEKLLSTVRLIHWNWNGWRSKKKLWIESNRMMNTQETFSLWCQNPQKLNEHKERNWKL